MPPVRRGTRLGRRAPRDARRRLAVLAPVVLAGAGVWVLSGYSAIVDARVVALEVTAAAVSIGASVLARTSHARRALALLSTYVVLTAVGDAYWLLGVDSSGAGHTLWESEPGFTVTVEVVRYLALLALLAHALPRRRGDGLGRRVPPRAGRGAGWTSGRSALAQMQVTASTAALVLLGTPVGALVGDGKAYSVFCFFDVVTTATALGVVLRALSSLPRTDRGPLRRLLATAAGVSGLVVGDAVMVLSQLRASVVGGGLGLVLAVGGAGVLVATYLRASHDEAGATPPLPPVPVRPRGHRVVVVAVLVQTVLPLLVAVLATARLGSATAEDLGAATLGTAAAALVLSLLRATVQAGHAARDEHAAAVADSDELTGAYTRRGFSASAERCLSGGLGWCVILLDLDGFKAVNDTHGHAAGDHVLRTVAARAAGVVDGHGILARFGGDEFVVLARTGSPTSPATRRLTRQLEEVIAAPTALDGGLVVQVGVSIGLAGIPEDGRGDGLAAALEIADRRMYSRKHGVLP